MLICADWYIGYAQTTNQTYPDIDIYISCDWGWYGACNGYYTGDVFATTNGVYTPSNFFAVKREVNE